MYDIVGKRNLWFAISAFLTLPGLLFIILGGLRPHERTKLYNQLREALK